MSGYVCLHRKIKSNALFKGNHDCRHLFVDMLPDAAWRPMTIDWRGTPVRVERGQLVSSLRNMSETYGFSLQKIRTMLKHMEAHGIITVNTVSNNGPTIITFCKYEEYQSGTDHLDNRSTHRQHTSQHTANTITNTPRTDRNPRKIRGFTDHQHTANTPDFKNQHTNQQAKEEYNNNKKNNTRAYTREADQINQALTCNQHKPGIWLENNRIVLSEDERAFWLDGKRFDGDQHQLDLALIQARPYVQPNGLVSVEAKVQSQLAGYLRDRKDKDRRYEAAAQAKKSKPSQWKDPEQAANERFLANLQNRLAQEARHA